MLAACVLDVTMAKLQWLSVYSPVKWEDIWDDIWDAINRLPLGVAEH